MDSRFLRRLVTTVAASRSKQPHDRGSGDPTGEGSMRANTATMVKSEKDVDDVADRLTGTLTTLMNELMPLQSAWLGQGGASFQQVRERFDQDMGRLNRSLRSLAEAVGTSGRNYDVSDQEMKSEMERSGATAGSITAALQL